MHFACFKLGHAKLPNAALSLQHNVQLLIEPLNFIFIYLFQLFRKVGNTCNLIDTLDLKIPDKCANNDIHLFINTYFTVCTKQQKTSPKIKQQSSVCNNFFLQQRYSSPEKSLITKFAAQIFACRKLLQDSVRRERLQNFETEPMWETAQA